MSSRFTKDKIKSCPICGLDMNIERHKKAGRYKSSRTYWVCSNTNFCTYRERSETIREERIRRGEFDESIGILPLTTEL
jgi:ssDNA-binding Zn-finger/Zn-ribbon topoisomerase 1